MRRLHRTHGAARGSTWLFTAERAVSRQRTASRASCSPRYPMSIARSCAATASQFSRAHRTSSPSDPTSCFQARRQQAVARRSKKAAASGWEVKRAQALSNSLRSMVKRCVCCSACRAPPVLAPPAAARHPTHSPHQCLTRTGRGLQTRASRLPVPTGRCCSCPVAQSGRMCESRTSPCSAAAWRPAYRGIQIRSRCAAH